MKGHIVANIPSDDGYATDLNVIIRQASNLAQPNYILQINCLLPEIRVYRILYRYWI